MTAATAPNGLAGAMPSMRECAVRLGMPQLAYDGLSEPWLLKELGDIHWRLIAEAAGLDQPAFSDGDGAPVYPAFCGTAITDASFGVPQENDTLVIASDLARVSPSQCASLHHLVCRGHFIGAVSLSSVFVKRGRPGANKGLARVSLAMMARLPMRRDFVPITALASAIRAETWHSHFGFSPTQAEALGQHSFRPCPAQDFNGAGFLYFPSFSAFVDRAEWAMCGRAGRVTARDVVYHGNIDVGETLSVAMMGLREDRATMTHWCRLVSSQGRRLADVFTRKSFDP